MDTEEFGKQIEHLMFRFDRLRQLSACGSLTGQAESLVATFETLAATLEELRVAENELHQQTALLDGPRRVSSTGDAHSQGLFDFSREDDGGHPIAGVRGARESQERSKAPLSGATLPTGESCLTEAHRICDLLEEIDAVVWAADAMTGRVTFVNLRAKELLGYPIERWVVEPDFWAHCIDPEDLSYAMDRRNKCAREGRDVESEFRVHAADGRVIWFHEILRRVDESQANAAELRGQMWNITKRKKAERQLYTARSELAGQLADLTQLHELSLRLLATPDLQPLLDEILTAVMALLGAEMGMLRLYDPARGAFDIAASEGISAEGLLEAANQPLGEIASEFSLKTQGRLVIEDIETESSFADNRASARREGYRGVFSTPLITRSGVVLGTVGARFREPYLPPDRQIELVELYVRQAADFIENARRDRHVLDSDGR